MDIEEQHRAIADKSAAGLVGGNPLLEQHYRYLNRQRIAFPEDAGTVIAWIDRQLRDVAASPPPSSTARK